MMKDKIIDKFAEALFEDIKNNLPESLSEASQNEIGKSINLIPKIVKHNDKYSFDMLHLSITLMMKDESNIHLSRSIRKSLEENIQKIPDKFRNLLFQSPPPVRVVLGLFALIYFLIPVVLLVAPAVNKSSGPLGIDMELLILVSLMGALGSITSIMVRIKDFTSEVGNSSILFFTGFFKPIIGTSFAVFIFSLLQSEIIPLDINKNSFFYLAIAFISGFSERFAQDIVMVTEKQINKNT